MNFAIDRFPDDKAAATDISIRLAGWYAAHASVRRLWTVVDSEALIVFVSLEPTSDGDDTLPIWLANQQVWSDELKSLADRDVQLKLIAPGTFVEGYVEMNAAAISELSWRDPWAFA